MGCGLSASRVEDVFVTVRASLKWIKERTDSSVTGKLQYETEHALRQTYELSLFSVSLRCGS